MAYLMNFVNGTTGNDVLLGTALNDSINGGLGADTMIGGLGDDTYVIDNAGDVVIENTGEGVDTIQASVNYTLSANVERLVLSGAATAGVGNALDNLLTNSTGHAVTFTGGAGNDTYYVSTGDAVIENASEGIDTVFASGSYTLGANIENLNFASGTGIGNDLNNVINGSVFSEVLDGGLGADTMSGGNGNDTYYVDNVGDVVVEVSPSVRGSGIDTVISSVNYTLSAGVENLTLTGSASSGTGNDLANVMTGNGHAVLAGGLGNDTYVVTTGDTVVEVAGAGTDTVQTNDAALADLRNTNVENITLTGSAAIAAFGNADNNILHGDTNSAANVLTGGAGNDTYYLGAGDTAVEAANGGTDTVYSTGNYTLGADIENLVLGGRSLTGTGNASANTITGTTGNDIINGMGGADTMIGGSGNDTYYVDNAGDVVVEANTTLMGNGADKVIASIDYALGTGVEILELTGAAINGIGNDLNNLLTNSTGHAVTLDGGLGNDTFVVSTGDKVSDSGGIDTIQTSDFILANLNTSAGIENITLIGSSAIDAVGTSADNVLRGDTNSSANALIGGAGNDTYYVGAGDTVVENAGEGTDTVVSSSSFTLGANVENLTLTGNVGLFGTGNDGDNAITGSNGSDYLSGGLGNDRLAGGLGNDVLYGGAGNDTFVFNTNNFSYANRDTIADFTVGQDHIELSKAVYGSALVNGAVDFASGAGMTSGAHVVLNTTTGMLYYDADGSGAGAGVAIAQFANTIPALSASDFTVV